jgi:effector-binding domain-containing protein
MAEPRIETRAEQPYVAIPATCTMATIGADLPPLIGEVFGWLVAREVTPAGDPFWKYDMVDMDRELEVEVGVPVAAPVTGDARVRAGVLPAGRYATVTHIGPYPGLGAATARLLEWARQQGLAWDMSPREGGGERWGARLEIYLNAPDEVPEDNLETVLAFRLAG